MNSFINAFRGRVPRESAVETLSEKLMFDREPKMERYVRFVTLLLLSTVIAAYGVLDDSVAVIIGAMIVAPLMTPILAVALSAITGDSRNIGRSLAVVAGGTVLVIGFSWLLSLAVPGVFLISRNESIASRVSPQLIDMVVALAAGAAGAFATSRDDVSDALPGVAIAVSLVPPLAVTGVCLAAGEWGWTRGAGMLVFAVMGFGKMVAAGEGRSARNRATATVIVALTLLVIPLGAASYNVSTARLHDQKLEYSTAEWLKNTDYDVIRLTIDGKDAELAVIGSGELPPIEKLQSEIRSRDMEVRVKVRIIPETVVECSTIP